MTKLASAVVCGGIALACLAICAMQFTQKGPVFSGAYLWASKHERKTMDRRPHYRQAGIAFALCAALFLSIVLECMLETGWLWFAAGIWAFAALAYAAVSSVREQIK